MKGLTKEKMTTANFVSKRRTIKTPRERKKMRRKNKEEEKGKTTKEEAAESEKLTEGGIGRNGERGLREEKEKGRKEEWRGMR